MLAVEYDGDHHRTEPVGSMSATPTRQEFISRVGWTHIKVLAEHRGDDVIHRVRQAWADATTAMTLRLPERCYSYFCALNAESTGKRGV